MIKSTIIISGSHKLKFYYKKIKINNKWKNENFYFTQHTHHSQSECQLKDMDTRCPHFVSDMYEMWILRVWDTC